MDVIFNNLDSIAFIIYCLVIGIICAFVSSLFTRGVIGKLVDRLIEEAADNPINAKTLDELGVKCGFILRYALTHKTVLSCLVSCDDEKEALEKRHLYIFPENQIKAQSLYGRQKLSPWSIVVAIVLFSAMLVLVNLIVSKIIVP